MEWNYNTNPGSGAGAAGGRGAELRPVVGVHAKRAMFGRKGDTVTRFLLQLAARILDALCLAPLVSGLDPF